MLLNTKFKKQQIILTEIYKRLLKNKADEIGRAQFITSACEYSEMKKIILKSV